MPGCVANARVGAITYNAVQLRRAVGVGLATRFRTNHSAIFFGLPHLGRSHRIRSNARIWAEVSGPFKDTHLSPDRHTLEIGSPSFGKLWRDDGRTQSSSPTSHKLKQRGMLNYHLNPRRDSTASRRTS
jgi:hypothetical protein